MPSSRRWTRAHGSSIRRTSAHPEATDAFVTKLGPTSARVYSTYLGGSSDDQGTGIAVDLTASAYVVGITGSTDLPRAGRPSQGHNGGGWDAYVAKLAAAACTASS